MRAKVRLVGENALRCYRKILPGLLVAFFLAGLMTAGCTMGPRPGFAGDRSGQGKGFGGPPPPMDTDRMVAELTRELGLTSEQEAKIKSIMTAHGEQVRQKMDADRQQMEKNREEMEALHKQIDDQIAQVLTEEQYQRFQQMSQKRRHRGPPPGGPHGPRE